MKITKHKQRRNRLINYNYPQNGYYFITMYIKNPNPNTISYYLNAHHKFQHNKFHHFP